jgi:Holliday junction resolvasome RuvABC endonuclease subunit
VIWGVDLGVRSLYAFGIDDSGNSFDLKVETPKMETRAMELKALAHEFHTFFEHSDQVFVEEPPLAGSRNIRVFAALNQVFSVALSQAPNAYHVEVGTWKKEVVGKGNATKDDVAHWLNDHHPVYAALCGDQNHIDAACIALYGRAVLTRL